MSSRSTTLPPLRRPTRATDMVARLGDVLYWACLLIGLAWLAVCVLSLQSSFETLTGAKLAFALVPAALAWLVGKAFRYVLAGR